MQIAVIIFWFLIFLVFYTYVGYGVFAWCWTRIRELSSKGYPKTPRTEVDPPGISFIIPAFDEETVIEKKIANTLSLEYPAEKLKVIVVSDGSTDNTAELVDTFGNIIHLHETARKGKAAALNRAVSHAATSDILIFSDANAFLNKEALLMMISHFHDPSVGGVAGEKKVRRYPGSPLQGESLYWRYESALKRIDSGFHTVVSAAGELFAIRRELCPELPEDTILDDLYITLSVCMKGYRIVYEPAAFAVEDPSISVSDEWNRKVRMGAGAFQAIPVFKSLLNPVRSGIVSFQFLSRRVFRWFVCPLALPLIFLLNILLLFKGTDPVPVYLSLFLIQAAFGLLAMAGWTLRTRRAGRFRLFHLPFYFIWMNLSMWAGFFRNLQGGQQVTWQKAVRQPLLPQDSRSPEKSG